MPKTETDIEKRNKYGMLCGIVGIFLNLILFAGKLFAGMFSGAISITADAFNNLSDAGSSIITIAGFKMAAQRADLMKGLKGTRILGTRNFVRPEKSVFEEQEHGMMRNTFG